MATILQVTVLLLLVPSIVLGHDSEESGEATRSKRESKESILSLACGQKQKTPEGGVMSGRRFTVTFPEMPSKSDEKREYMVQVATDENRLVSVSIRLPQRNFEVLKSGIVRRDYVKTMLLQDNNLRAQGSKLFRDRTISVEATGNVIVWVSLQQGRCKYGYNAIPDSVLGEKYYAIAFAPFNIEKGGKAQLGLVATQPDTTSATVKFPAKPTQTDSKPLIVNYDGKQYTNGQSFPVQMQQYDFVQIQAEQGDITGTKVTANQKIGFTSGNTETSIGDTIGSRGPMDLADSTVEQLPPVDTWGTEFISVVPSPARVTTMRFRLKVVCSFPTTEFKVDSRTFFLRHPGDYAEVDIGQPDNGDRPIHLKATKPVLVAQFVQSLESSNQVVPQGQGAGDNQRLINTLAHSLGLLNNQRKMPQRDAERWTAPQALPAMILLQSIDQWANRYNFDCKKYDYNPSWIYSYVLCMYVETAWKDQVVYDYLFVSKAITWKEVANTPYSAGCMQIGWGYHVLYNLNADVKMGAWLYGAQNEAQSSYGYSLGLRLQKTTCVKCDAVFCDLRDNDCDYTQDEEVSDGKDNDGDGEVDEDVCGLWDITISQNVLWGIIGVGGTSALILGTLAVVYALGG